MRVPGATKPSSSSYSITHALRIGPTAAPQWDHLLVIAELHSVHFIPIGLLKGLVLGIAVGLRHTAGELTVNKQALHRTTLRSASVYER